MYEVDMQEKGIINQIMIEFLYLSNFLLKNFSENQE